MLLSCVSFIESQNIILTGCWENEKQTPNTREQRAKSKNLNGGWEGTNWEIGNNFRRYLQTMLLMIQISRYLRYLQWQVRYSIIPLPGPPFPAWMMGGGILG